MNPGIILATHLKSKRLPKKALIPINGRPALSWLLDRLDQALSIPIILATPYEEASEFNEALNLKQYKNVKIFTGHSRHVLQRIVSAASYFKINPVIRITHDDILICPLLLQEMIYDFEKSDIDYLYCSKVPEGLATEIISFKSLENALNKVGAQNVEHISYYVRTKENKVKEFIPHQNYQKKMRLTLDYPQDHTLLEILFSLKNITLEPTHAHFPLDLIHYIDMNRYLLKINELPEITLYTPNHNYQKFIHSCLQSIRTQSFQDFEYYYIDDGCYDNSIRIIASFSDIKILINSNRKGISFSANRVLERAKGKYIMRIDADDVLLPHALYDLYHYMEENQNIAIAYSGYYRTDENLNILETVLENKENHLGCALVRKSCLNEVKFRDNLEHFDSLDIYQKFQDRFQIGYLKTPLFYYRKHDSSWSEKSSHIETRAKVLKSLENKHYG